MAAASAALRGATERTVVAASVPARWPDVLLPAKDRFAGRDNRRATARTNPMTGHSHIFRSMLAQKGFHLTEAFLCNHSSPDIRANALGESIENPARGLNCFLRTLTDDEDHHDVPFPPSMPGFAL